MVHLATFLSPAHGDLFSGRNFWRGLALSWFGKGAMALPLFCVLRSLPGLFGLDAIPGRVFSSSLPPSFASGRFATSFFSGA